MFSYHMQLRNYCESL